MDRRHYNHKYLQQIREQHYTQEQLAERLNKHVKTISRAETGKSASFQLIAEIMQACNKSVKEVIYDVPLAN